MTESGERVYLRGDVKLEPLVFRWYAYGHMVSPVQQALNLAYRNIPLLDSFIADAPLHEATARNPQMLGGRFVELTQNDVAAVRALLERTREQGRALLDFARDLLALDRALQLKATGYCLDHFYAALPKSLSGLIEVAYDLNDQPSIHVQEALAHKEVLGSEAAQEISFSTVPDDARAFFLNTPRIDAPERLVLPAPFAGEAYDLLSASRISPVPLVEMTRVLGVPPGSQARFRSFFSPAAPQRNEPAYHGDAVRVRHFGHACVLIQTQEVAVLVDPFFTWDVQESGNRLTFHDLPDFIDYVFITHGHQDHFSIEVLLQLRKRIGHILVPRNTVQGFADPSLKLALRRIGFENVIVMDPLDELSIRGGRLISLPFLGEHADLCITSKSGLCVEVKGRKLMLVADSDAKDRMLYRRIARHLGKMDVLFVGMECVGAPLSWLYGPYSSQPIGSANDESRRLSGSDCERAWSLIEEFDCPNVFVYAMGQEPWLRFVAGLEYEPDSKQLVESNKLVQRCRAAGKRAERLHGCRTVEF